MSNIIGDEDPSSATRRVTTNSRVDTLDAKSVLLLADSLFSGSNSGCFETTLLELGFELEFVTAKGPSGIAHPFPTRSKLLTEDATVEAMKFLSRYARFFAKRLIYLLAKARPSFVRPDNIIALGAAAQMFPSSTTPRRREATFPNLENKREQISWTMHPRHLELADKLAEEVFKEPRTRRKLWVYAVSRYMENHAMSVANPFPVFKTYPRLALLNANLFYDRYVVSMFEALNVITKGQLPSNDEVAQALRSDILDVAELLIHDRPLFHPRQMSELAKLNLY